MTTQQEQKKELRAIKTVYSYRFPETKQVISGLFANFPHDIFMQSVSSDGSCGGLDLFDQPIIDNVIRFHSPQAPNLKDFKHRYPTSGSEEGIREFMTRLAVVDGVKEILVLPGEYEGYQEVAKTRGIRTKVVELDDLVKVEPGFLFVSNPSARDGKIIPNTILKEIADHGHKIFYDLAYLGSTHAHQYDLDHENIVAAVVSFSKPFGTFYDRVGFTFSKQPVDALYGNKWFKSIEALLIANAITQNFETDTIAKIYKPVQADIVEQIRNESGIPVVAADPVLLATLTNQQAEDAKLSSKKLAMIAPFRRGNGYRFCLTPYYLEREGM